MPKNFEMANANDPAGIIAATQRSLIEGMRGVLNDMRKSDGPLSKVPGLTWDQIDYFLVEFGKKTPTVIHQKGEM